MRRIITVTLGILLSLSMNGQNVSVSTNLADYAMLGTLNVGASVGVDRHWTVDASLKYNPFTFRSDFGTGQYQQRLLSAGAKWWPWHIFSGWWACAKAQYQEFSNGGFSSAEISEGDRYGGNLSAGYTYMLGEHLNLDFGLGLWGGYEKYVTYACPNCGSVVDEGAKYFILPSDIILSLSYIF